MLEQEKDNVKKIYEKKVVEKKTKEELQKVNGGSAVTVDVTSTVETHSENNSKTLNAGNIGGNVSF